MSEISPARDSIDNGTSNGVADSSRTFLAELESTSKSSVSAAPKGMVIVCDGNTCVPFSTRKSGTNDSSSFVNENFLNFDTGRDGSIDTKELNQWSKKFDKDSDVQQMTDLVAKHLPTIASLHDDGDSDKEIAITKTDLEAVARLRGKNPETLTKNEAALIEALDLDKQKAIKKQQSENPSN